MEWERSMADTGNGQGANTVREGDVAAPVAPIAAAAFDRAHVSTPPWDMLSPQPAFVRLVQAGRIAGSVLDIGCGTGELALYLSERGLAVLGIDRSLLTINKAQAKAVERGLAVWFAVADAVALGDLDEICGTVVDRRLQHVLSDAEHTALVPGLQTSSVSWRPLPRTVLQQARGGCHRTTGGTTSGAAHPLRQCVPVLLHLFLEHGQPAAARFGYGVPFRYRIDRFTDA